MDRCPWCQQATTHAGLINDLRHQLADEIIQYAQTVWHDPAGKWFNQGLTHAAAIVRHGSQ